MVYTEEVLKLQLMNIMGYTEQAAAQIVETYRQNGNLEDLYALMEAKKSVVY